MWMCLNNVNNFRGEEWKVNSETNHVRSFDSVSFDTHIHPVVSARWLGIYAHISAVFGRWLGIYLFIFSWLFGPSTLESWYNCWFRLHVYGCTRENWGVCLIIWGRGCPSEDIFFCTPILSICLCYVLLPCWFRFWHEEPIKTISLMDCRCRFVKGTWHAYYAGLLCLWTQFIKLHNKAMPMTEINSVHVNWIWVNPLFHEQEVLQH